MDVLMPQLGETVSEGRIAAWFKQPGEQVEAGDLLFAVETDKASMDVQALASGPLGAILVQAGQSAPVGAVLARIGAQGATPAQRDDTRVPSAAATAPSPPARGFAPFNEVFTPPANFGRARLADDMRITPLARRLIAQSGLDVESIAARVRAAGRTRIAADDVRAASQTQDRRTQPLQTQAVTPAPSPAIAFPITGPREVETPNRIRRVAGQRLEAGWRTIPHVVQAVEIDFGAVAAARDRHRNAVRRTQDAPLTWLAFIARAVCLAIRAWPRVNAAFDGERLHVAREINLCFAIDLDHEGLVAPVVRNADRLTVAGLAGAIHALASKARAGALRPEDFEGGTYSITNNGGFGTLFTAPLINPPQTAILSVDAIAKRALVKETEYGDVIVARPAGILAQSFDHRAFDGAYSASFLARLKSIIETRDWDAELT